MECNSKTIPDLILSSLYGKLSGYNHGITNRRLKSIHGFTEIKIQNECNNKLLYCLRCCPNFRSTKDWYDWCNVNWGDDYGILPCQILLFLDFTTMKFEEYQSDDNIEMNIQHKDIEYNICNSYVPM